MSCRKSGIRYSRVGIEFARPAMARFPPSLEDITGALQEGRTTMARKPTAKTELVFFDVIYEDGSQNSNRRIPGNILGGLDGDEPARALIEEQDRVIAEKRGMAPLKIKTIRRSNGK
jgi:hypothetical protein